MSKAGRKTKRLKRHTSAQRQTVPLADFLRRRLTNRDPRSHEQYLETCESSNPLGG